VASYFVFFAQLFYERMPLIQTIFNTNEHASYEVLIENWILDNYKLGHVPISIKKDNLDSLIKQVDHYCQKQGYEKLEFSELKDPVNPRLIYRNNQILLWITDLRETYEIEIYTNNLDDLTTIQNIVYNFRKIQETDAEILYSSISRGQMGIIEKAVIKTLKDYEKISYKYYPFLKVKEFINQFLIGKESILLLGGEVGTGKSKFATLVLKFVLQNPEIIDNFEERKELYDILEQPRQFKVAYIKNVQILNEDMLWDKLRNYHLVIMDDLDFVLSSRSESREDVLKNQFISHFLSFTDGTHENKTKFIITTNQPYNEIDEALLRPGRLYAVLNFRPLTWDEALDIWEEFGLNETEFEEHFHNKDYINQAELGSIIENKLMNKEYIDIRNYILDPEIDVVNKIEKRAGLI